MRLIAALLILLATAAPVYSLTNITECGTTLSSAGETYQLTGNLTCNTGTAITVGANGVTINCQNYTLAFAQTAAATGINIGGYDNTTIKNCVFSTAFTTADANSIYHVQLGDAAATGTTIQNCTFNVLGRSGVNNKDAGIEGNAGTGSTITGNTFSVTGYDRTPSIKASGGAYTISNNTFSVDTYAYSDSVAPNYNTFIWFEDLDATVSGTVNNNTFTVGANAKLFYPVHGWDADNVQVLRNTFTFKAAHGRVICPDNASSGWTIQDNRITVSDTGAELSSYFREVYGIRYRNANNSGGNCGGGHTINYNTVDCSGYTGNGGCVPISVGGYADETNPCYQTDVSYNYFKAISGAFSFYQSSPSGALNATDQDIYCNKIEATNGYPVAIANAANELTDIKFSHNLLIGGTGGKNVSTGVAWSTAVDFCGGTAPAVTTGSVTASEAPCQDGATECYSTAGVRASHAAATLGSGCAATMGTGAVATFY